MLVGPVRARRRAMVAGRGTARTSRSGNCRPTGSGWSPTSRRAMDRIPSLADTGVRTFFCGPESFTADVRPLLGPAPELDGYFVAAGPELAGHPVRRRSGQHARALDRGRRAAGGRDQRRHRPDRYLRDVPPVPGRAHCRAARRAVRRRGLARLEAVDRRGTCAGRCCTTGWSRPAATSASRRAGSSPSGSPARRGTRAAPGLPPAGLARRSSSASTARSARRSACWT